MNKDINQIFVITYPDAIITGTYSIITTNLDKTVSTTADIDLLFGQGNF